ncbi:hypothetical protein D6792_00960 [Candidatus Parcubacteria bacterium]|nr:MAG: hypothetical protein D6792_00960 [Candidatus Parcubacteria bacterium]GIW69003.1 MAG: hypothetical protein KatS3mg100_497 [Candidatus Parcubacteria bacterium]
MDLDLTCSSCRKAAEALPPLPWGYFKHLTNPFAAPEEPRLGYYARNLWEYAFTEKCEHCFVRGLLSEGEMALCWDADYPADPYLLRFYAHSLRWAWGGARDDTLRYLIPQRPPHLKKLITAEVLRKHADDIVKILAKDSKAARQAAALIARAIWRHAQREIEKLDLNPLVEHWLQSYSEGEGRDPLRLLREYDEE